MISKLSCKITNVPDAVTIDLFQIAAEQIKRIRPKISGRQINLHMFMHERIAVKQFYMVFRFSGFGHSSDPFKM